MANNTGHNRPRQYFIVFLNYFFSIFGVVATFDRRSFKFCILFFFCLLPMREGRKQPQQNIQGKRQSRAHIVDTYTTNIDGVQLAAALPLRGWLIPSICDTMMHCVIRIVVRIHSQLTRTQHNTGFCGHSVKPYNVLSTVALSLCTEN